MTMPRSGLLLLVSLSLGVSALAQDTRAPRLMLNYGAFDPLQGELQVPLAFAADPASTLVLVQFTSEPTPADREALANADAKVMWYAPYNGYIVRTAARQKLAALDRVRWVGAFHPAYKYEPALFAALMSGPVRPDRYVIVLVDPKHDENALVAAIQACGGTMWRYAGGNLLIEADLTAAQVTSIAREDTVLWIQKSQPPGNDMNNARIQGGANYIEQLAGHTGKGVRGHIMEGIYATHPEFSANAYRTAPQSVFLGTSDSHGCSTFGCVFSAGLTANARGMCPDGQGYYTHYNFIFSTPAGSTAQNSRYGVVQAITDPAGPWRVMFQTASWGFPQIPNYDARSAEMDHTIFTFDIPICQSMSNTSNNNARPQAWAKNIISCGAIVHANTSTVVDDTQSGTSMGPAQDLRIKPDMCAYYDNVHTTSTATGYTLGFNGTSSATPIVAGHVGLIIEMFTDGYFGHPAAPTWQDRFDYKAHFTTTKALLINTARQYDPTVVSAGTASRYRQGWGFPALHDLYDLRKQMLVLDEIDVLQQGQARTYFVHVKPNTPQFRTTMVYADLPLATPFSSPHRVNDLSVKVTAPNGTFYYGNTGMATTPVTHYTAPGGSPNTLDTVENVYVQNPAYGLWQVEVSAPLVALDQHVETPAVDADFALVSSGIGGGRDDSGPVMDLTSTGPGDLSVAITNNPASYVEGFTLFSLTTARPLAMGNFLGLEVDSLAFLSLGSAAGPGNPLHFTYTTDPSLFPNAPFTFPAFIAQFLQGFAIDAVAFYIDATGGIHAASSVDRVVIQ
ncbi:MAG TPA: S8 family serine peptidase [Planctomycetota bacterium]|nr:S8 family serine peptidase [Planctomycetota bacterium]